MRSEKRAKQRGVSTRELVGEGGTHVERSEGGKCFDRDSFRLLVEQRSEISSEEGVVQRGGKDRLSTAMTKSAIGAKERKED